MLLSTFAVERITAELLKQQHIHPHQSIGEALHGAQHAIGFCPATVQQSAASLQIDITRKIGRMKRVELSLLARTIARLWKQNLAGPTPQPA